MNRKLLAAFLFGLMTTLLFGYTNDWTESTPTDSTVANQIDDFNRKVRIDTAERLEDYLGGFNASDSNEGFYHVLFIENANSLSQPAANKGLLYGKLTDTKCELTWLDESDNEIQLTSKGDRLANDTYFTATDNAGTGSVNLIKADANDNIYIGDGIVGHTTAAKTSAYTVKTDELDDNFTFTNTGTSDVVPITLPPGVTGYKTGFLVTDTDGFQIDPDGTEQFYMWVVGAGGLGKYITASIVGAYVEVEFDGTYWTIVNIVGIWDIES